MAHARKHPFACRKLVALIAAALSGSPYAHNDSSAISAQLLSLPITFERNDGQFPAEVLFASRGRHGTLMLRAGEMAISPRLELGHAREPVRLRMLGANLAPEVQPQRALVTRSHYYTGARPIEDVPHYGELRVKDVYPGIDVALHGRDGVLEYDFVVAPGADPRDIRIDLGGIESAYVDGQGNLRFEHQGQMLAQQAPIAYQGEGGERRPVPAHFELVEGPEGPEARIALGAYDTGSQLTVDPVLAYSTYVGASGGDGMHVKADPAGNLYFSYREAVGGARVLAKLNPATNTFGYKTFFGGNGFTNVNAIVLGASGSQVTPYIAGDTSSTDFPNAGAPLNYDGYVARFSPTGTFLGGTRIAGFGGSGDEFARALCIDGTGFLYAAGTTNSANFPTTSGQVRNGSGNPTATTDAWMIKLNSGFFPSYRRLLGGTGNEFINGCAVDSLGQLIVVGSTASTDFPLAGPSGSPPPQPGSTRAFATKLTVDGTSSLYSSFIGGSATSASGVALDPATGQAVVVGSINGPSLLPASSVPYAGGASDGYILRLGASGTPISGMFIGGGGTDGINAVAVSDQGDVYVTGSTNSINFPVVNAPPGMGVLHGGAGQDAFITRVRGGAVDFSMYLGGGGDEFALAITPDMTGSVYVGGGTNSTDFPTVNPLFATRQFFADSYLAKVSGLGLPPPSVANISTRMQVLTGNDVMIGGFVIGGTGTKRVAVVATGPSLSQFGIANPLANPKLTLVRASDQTIVATNDDWQTAANAADLTASGFAPTNALEAAILADLSPGAYTAIVEGLDNGTGVSVVGVYEVDRPEAPLVNISTRGRVQTGNDVMIGGFVVGGTLPQTLAIVATGPSLAAFGITSPLANPKVTLVRSSDQVIIATNDDWQAGTHAAQLQAAGFAPTDPLEAALLVTLPPGAYTAIVEGVGGTTGVAVVGVYAVN